MVAPQTRYSYLPSADAARLGASRTSTNRVSKRSGTWTVSAEGRSTKEVASLLNISARTAEFHRARLMKALGVRTTADLVQYAIRNGLISV